jgi:hypothetical protein
MKWFATHIDRDFQYGGYGNGKPRLYVSDNIYAHITPMAYRGGVLTVKDEWGDTFDITTEPDNEWFRQTLYKKWLKFDEKMVGDEDRSDYEPWAYNSLEAIAAEFKLTKAPKKMFYKPREISG